MRASHGSVVALVAAMALALVASGVAVASPFTAVFGGSSPSAGGVEPCGEGEACAADSYEATTTSGPGFACNSQVSSCIDLGPGTNNELGTNGSGDVTLGSGGGGVLRVGDGFTATGNGSVTAVNGAMNLNGSTVLRDEFGGAVDILSPISLNGGSSVSKLTRAPLVTIDIPEIGNLGTYTDVFAVTGVAADDSVLVNPTAACSLPDGFGIAYAQASGTNQVRVSFRNGNNASSINPASCDFIFWVLR